MCTCTFQALGSAFLAIWEEIWAKFSAWYDTLPTDRSAKIIDNICRDGPSWEIVPTLNYYKALGYNITKKSKEKIFSTLLWCIYSKYPTYTVIPSCKNSLSKIIVLKPHETSNVSHTSYWQTLYIIKSTSCWSKLCYEQQCPTVRDLLRAHPM